MTLLLDVPLKTSLVPMVGSGSASITRATTKNVFDNEGKLITVKSGAVAMGGVRCVQNLVVDSSEDFTNANWTKSRATISSGKLIDSVDANTTHRLYQASSSSGLGDYAGYFEVKQAEWTDCAIGISNQIETYRYRVRFNLATGAVSAINGSGSAAIESLADGWYRCWVKGSLIPGDLGYGFFLYLYDSINGTAFTGTGTKGIYVRAAQLENVTGQADQTASEYVSVGVLPAPYHGAGVYGVKYFATNKDGTVIESSAQHGASIDPASKTNTMLYCRDFTNAAWVKTNTTATKNQTGIDGLTSGCSLIEFNADGATILQTIAAAAAAGCTGFDVKLHTGTGTIEITRDNVNWADITSLINTDTFTTVAIENTSVTNPIVGFRGTSGDKIIVDAGRNHLGTELCEPIFTTTASVTRNAEVLTYQTSGNFSDTAGTILATFTPLYDTWPSGAVVGKSGSGLLISSSNSGAQAADGTNTVNGATGAPANSSIRIGCRWSGSSLEAFSADPLLSVGTAGSYDGSFNLSTIAINPGAAGYIKDVKVYDASLSDAEVKTAWALLDSQTFLPAFSNLPIYNAGAIIHVEPDPEPVDPEPTPIFATEFTGLTVTGPQDFLKYNGVDNTACIYKFTGTDTETGFGPPTAAPVYANSGSGAWGVGYGVHVNSAQTVAYPFPTADAAGVNTRHTTDIVATTVRGEATNALRLKWIAPGASTNFDQQSWFMLWRSYNTSLDFTELTVRFEIKLPDLSVVLPTTPTGVLVLFDYKTNSATQGGDFRIKVQIIRTGLSTYVWQFEGDNVANGINPTLTPISFWSLTSTETVPQQENFTLEVSIKRPYAAVRTAAYNVLSGAHAGKARLRIRRESDSVTTWRTLCDASESGIAAYNSAKGTSFVNRHMGVRGFALNRLMHGNYARKNNVDFAVEIAKFRMFDTFDV